MKKTLKEQLENNRKYNEAQYQTAIGKWISGNLKRNDRDMAIRCRTRADMYQEVIELLDKQQ
jgi:hypothetical protein